VFGEKISGICLSRGEFFVELNEHDAMRGDCDAFSLKNLFCFKNNGHFDF
jgi:hypothetical protein